MSGGSYNYLYCAVDVDRNLVDTLEDFDDMIYSLKNYHPNCHRVLDVVQQLRNEIFAKRHILFDYEKEFLPENQHYLVENLHAFFQKYQIVLKTVEWVDSHDWMESDLENLESEL